MVKIIRYILFVFVLFLLNSCFLNVYRLSNDDLAWTEMYKTNDTIMFVGLDNVKDSLIIFDSSIDNPENPKAKNENDIFGDYCCGASVEGYFLHKGIRSDVSLFVIRESDEVLTLALYIDKHDTEMILKGSSVKSVDCIAYNYGNNDADSLVQTIVHLKWCRRKGITEYKMSDGHTYICGNDSF